MTTTGVAVRTIKPNRLGISPWKAFKTDVREWFSDEEIEKSKQYMAPLRRVHRISTALSFVVDLAIIRTHAMPELLDSLGLNNWFLEVMVVMAVTTAIGLVIGIPFSWWEDMVHQKKWGFSTMTKKTFFVDLVKGLTIGLVLNAVLIGLLWWIIRSTELWWLLGWAAISVISVGFGIIYPRVISPMFNKFQKLDNEALHAKVIDVAHSVGADISTVEIEDTSKRDTRPNAYVGGAGKTRRMVVCDNMLQWDDAELVSVCGHEIGHWRLKHLLKRIPLLVALQLVSFVVLKLVFSNDEVLEFAGVNSLGDPGAVPLFFFVFSLPALVTGPIGSYLSRVHEREADLFGLEAVKDAPAAATAFRKLQEETIGDLSPSLWSRLNRSHPLISERLAMIKEWERRNSSTPV